MHTAGNDSRQWSRHLEVCIMCKWDRKFSSESPNRLSTSAYCGIVHLIQKIYIHIRPTVITNILDPQHAINISMTCEFRTTCHRKRHRKWDTPRIKDTPSGIREIIIRRKVSHDKPNWQWKQRLKGTKTLFSTGQKKKEKKKKYLCRAHQFIIQTRLDQQFSKAQHDFPVWIDYSDKHGCGKRTYPIWRPLSTTNMDFNTAQRKKKTED